MNYSTAVFLINKHARAIVATYEADDKAPRTTFKTLDPSIKEGDYVIVETDTRHKITVCKVVETDVDFDFDTPAKMSWVIGKVDRAAFDLTLQQEQSAIAAIKSAELRKKREDLKKSMFADHMESIKALPIYANGENVEAESKA